VEAIATSVDPEVQPETAERPVPIVPPTATVKERFVGFADHLRTAGVRYRTISESSVMLSYEAGILELGFVSERTLKRGQSLCGEADVLRFGQIFFADLKRIRASLRPNDAEALTAKETAEKLRKERNQALFDETHADPLVQDLQNRLDAKVESVKALDE
jgi:hypothetical protein